MALTAPYPQRRDFTAKVLTWTVVVACLLMLTSLVLTRRGNLAWDDADYLRRGLANARLAAGDDALGTLPRSVDLLLQEQPKPPFLVAWLMMGASMVGRANLDALIVHGSVVPFGLLMLTTLGLARRFHGTWAGLLALVILAGSPRALAFGGKVMVETFLGLWVMLALALAAMLPVRPSRRVGALLGLATGLALLTKLTAVLLLGGALVLLGWWVARRDPDRPARLRAGGWAIVACLAVAGPWYARNLPAAIRFGVFSSRFNLDAEGRSEIIAPLDRLLILAADLPGWPLATVLGAVVICSLPFFPSPFGRGCFGVPGRMRGSLDGLGQPSPGLRPPSPWGRGFESGQPAKQSIATRFRLLVVASTLVASIVLMFPHHFDSRFLLPLWPALAVALSGWLAGALRSLAPRRRLVAGAALVTSLAAAVVGLVREPISTTCWDASGLIDELVAHHGVSSIANVGNTEGWNVCKTGLVNELRDNPDDCFVLHDLSAETGQELRTRLSRFDAVVVLEPSAFPPGFREALPALNRSYSAIAQAIKADPELMPVQGVSRGGLPPLACYVRCRGVAPIRIADNDPRQPAPTSSSLK